MITTVVLYIAASVDGYIARSNGGTDWLSIVEREGEDYGYAAFYESVDAIVMGSKTYELALSFGEWPYSGKKSFIFTRRDFKSDREDVMFVSDTVNHVLTRMKAQGFKKIWLVGGGALTSSFFQRGLIDEYIISTIPIILGQGIPLFLPSGREEKLDLIALKQYPSGLVQAHYRNKRDV
jgi:dihydrofolate reductase